jgi:hypothetical protein
MGRMESGKVGRVIIIKNTEKWSTKQKTPLSLDCTSVSCYNFSGRVKPLPELF